MSAANAEGQTLQLAGAAELKLRDRLGTGTVARVVYTEYGDLVH